MRPEQGQFLEQMFREYARKLTIYARAYLRDPHRAEEMVQDTFHEAIGQIDKLMIHPLPERWLKQTLKNKMRNSERIRRRDLRRLVSLDQEDRASVITEDSLEETVALRQANESSVEEKIEKALSREEIYLLKRLTLDKATHLEMAEELGITVWTSQKRIERIRKKLAEVFPEKKKVAKNKK